MNRIRLLGLWGAVGAVVTLAGCVAPGTYYEDAGYSQPYGYYHYPAPVVVVPPVYIQGGGYYGWGASYYRKPYRPPYDDGRGRWGYGHPPQQPLPGATRPSIGVPSTRPSIGVAPTRPPIAVPPTRGPSVTITPSWNSKEQP
jgi:hypothetical protein